jgi:hypothetical protein
MTMRRKLEIIGYTLCFGNGRISRLWSRIFFRWYCPYPLRGDWSARACIKAGDCGCDNHP